MNLNVRCIAANCLVYACIYDISEYIEQIADGEETDVRNRLLKAAREIRSIGKKEL